MRKYGLAAWFFVCFAIGAVIAGWYDYSTTAASNATIDGVSVPVGALPPSNVGPALRAMAASNAAFLDDIGCAVTASGTDTITFNAVSNPYSGAATYADGDTFCFIAGGTNTGAATFNVDSEGAKAIRKGADAALVGGELVTNGMYTVHYDASANSAAGAFLLESPPEVLATGVWTATDSANSNLDSATAAEGQYLRVGNVFTASTQVTADPTGASSVSFELSLPITTNLGATSDCAGGGSTNQTGDGPIRVEGVAANDTVIVEYVNTVTTSVRMSITFTCQII